MYLSAHGKIKKMLAAVFMMLVLLPALSVQAAGTKENNDAAAVTGQVKSPSFRDSFSAATGVIYDGNYRSPVDFKRLQTVNSDIYAWLRIPGTNIDYPLLQSGTDDGYYLNHSRSHTGSSNGELYTEHRYNGTGLEDPVTVVYGHNMRSGKMFGRLQRYYQGNIRKCGIIHVYLPDGELTYRVFAAIPYSSMHILATYNFQSAAVYDRFFTKIRKTRVLGGMVDRSVIIKPEDKVLILSTCLAGNHNDRFLVMARLTGAKTNQK